MLPQTTDSRTLTIAEHTAPLATWQRAISRARAEGVRVQRHGDTWLATSTSDPTRVHTVNGRCDCEGATFGLVCKHEAAVRSAQLGAGELYVCQECGRVAAARHEVGHSLGWLGGHGWIDTYHCTAGHGCAA
jgi:hypothetical protein